MNRPTRTRLGPRFTEGARLTWLALQERGWSATDLRRRLTGRGGAPMGTGVVDGWLYGDGAPGRESSAQLEQLLGVPVSTWSTKPSEGFTLPAARKAARGKRVRGPKKGDAGHAADNATA